MTRLEGVHCIVIIILDHHNAYPHLENTVSGLLGNQLLGNILTNFTHSNSILSRDFTCSGRINSWLIGGIPGEPDGNQFTLNQFTSTQDGGISQVARTTIGISDIVPTDSPNVYRINTTLSQFELESGDSIIITYDDTVSDNNEFTINSINVEVRDFVNNIDNSASQSFFINFPLLSLEISSKLAYTLLPMSAIGILDIVRYHIWPNEDCIKTI